MSATSEAAAVEASAAVDVATLPKRTRDLLVRMDKAFVKIDRLLFRLGQQGVQRMTASSVVELQALGQTAHNAGLIKCERYIETLATLVTRYLERDPLFTMVDYATTINRIWLLNNQARRRRAEGVLPADMPDILGQARRVYRLLEDPLTLQPIGASGWVTDTDYVGITVYLYCGLDGRIYQVTNAKPTMYFGNDPRTLLRNPISDYCAFTISDLAHGAFLFTNVKEVDGRLSLHKELVVSPATWFGADAYEGLAARDWVALVDRLREGELHPVAGADSSLAYIEPTSYSPLVVDDKRQTATTVLSDERGASMVLEVALRVENNFLIDNLQFLETHAGMGSGKGQRRWLLPNGLFGRARVQDGTLKFAPISAIYHDGVTLQGRTSQRVHEIHLSIEDLARVRQA